MEGVILCCDGAHGATLVSSSDPNSGSDERAKHGRGRPMPSATLAPGEELTFAVDEDVDAARKLGPAYSELAQKIGS